MSAEKQTSTASGKSAVKTLGFFGFFAMTASMVMTVYAYPNFASSGLHLIFFLILGGIFLVSSRCISCCRDGNG